MDVLMLVFCAMVTYLYCYLTVLDARRIDACQEPEFVSEIDQYRTAAFMAHWSTIYQTNPALHCVEFHCFLLNPRGYLAALVWRTSDDEVPESLPLLPRQIYVADKLEYDQLQQEKQLQQLEKQYSQISNRNGKFFIPMHTRRPRKWQTRGAHLKPV